MSNKNNNDELRADIPSLANAKAQKGIGVYAPGASRCLVNALW